MSEKESHDAYEQRTWREKLHYDENGEVFIPPMALKQALTEACMMTGRKIQGRGQATYTKHFEAGVLCTSPVAIGVKKDDVTGERIYAHANGKRGSGRRVWRWFPHIPSGWQGTAEFVILDETVTPEVFEETLTEAGRFVGIGRYRPRNGGMYGRFVVDAVEAAEG